MFLIVIFLSQIVFANAQTPIMPPVQFRDRTDPNDKNFDPTYVKAACELIHGTSAMPGFKTCVDNYRLDKIQFTYPQIEFCTASTEFITKAHKKICLDGIKGKAFDFEKLKDCMEAARSKHKGNLNNVSVYKDCFDNNKVLLQPVPQFKKNNSAPTQQGGTGSR